jgi:hypothetical protein
MTTTTVAILSSLVATECHHLLLVVVLLGVSKADNKADNKVDNKVVMVMADMQAISMAALLPGCSKVKVDMEPLLRHPLVCMMVSYREFQANTRLADGQPPPPPPPGQDTNPPPPPPPPM